MLIYEANLHKKNGALSQLGAEKITFPPKPDEQTYSQTDGRTFAFRASLLKKKFLFVINLSITKIFDYLVI